MKRRMTLSLVLTLSVLLSLVSFPSPAQGQQPPGRFSARSGVVTLGMGQGLRVTVLNTDGKDIRVRFAWTQYMAAGCSGMPPVCRHTVASQAATAPETLGTNDALSFDVPVTGQAVNVTIRSNSQNADVVFIVFDTSTQRILATIYGSRDTQQ